ncbi:MAG TPA: SdrD B-like domain-containing protein, partial [Verrucomicrobiota bacterium]|nr:SdrD B-like domain-containing protein [Verrucomicrobiota bacterium]
GDRVWNDANGNGVQDSGEPGISGVVVQLTITWPGSATSTVVQTVTDASGYYAFENLLLDENYDGAGMGEPTYSIMIPLANQPGTPSPTGQGTAATDSNDADGTAAYPVESFFDVTYDFGFYNVTVGPDVTPVITAQPNVMHGPTDFNLRVQVVELNRVATQGTITLRIPKDSRWILREPYDPSLTILDGVPMENYKWAYSEDSTHHIFTTVNSGIFIPAGSFSYFGIKTKWSSPATEGKYTITVQIDSWSGNENRIDNNADAEKIDFFDN